MIRWFITPGLCLLLAACSTPPPAAETAGPTGSLSAAQVGSLSVAPAEASTVFLYGSLAFVGCGADGVRIVDVSDPSQPEVVATLDDLPAGALCVDDDLLYVLDVPEGWFAGPASVTSVDVIDPREPGVRRTIRRSIGEPGDLSVAGDSLALAGGDEGLFLGRGMSDSLVDLSHHLDSDRALSVLAGRDRLFAFGQSDDFDFWLGYGQTSNALVVLEIPSGRLLSRTEFPGEGGADLAFTGDLLLLAHGDFVRVITVGPTGEPSRIISLHVDSVRAVSCDGSVAAAVGEGVTLIDLSEPDLPVLAARVAIEGTARDVAVQGRLVAVAAGGGGLQLFEVHSE
ncbi:MAG: hypothetical protein V2A76_01275 [Planctomycetota bacterium]